MSSSPYPRIPEQVLFDYQIELENWVRSASIDEIRDYFVILHGGVFPDDWHDCVSRHQNNSSGDLEHISSCEQCQYLLLAIHTMSSCRKKLKSLFVNRI
ncbi:hypothetical protein ACLRAA_05760 [Gallibacterium anatis]|uniref:Uncharacterized protein n=1 Tax=Gallibacterium anatis 12656/12 TaxID=1195244 RepID=U1I1V9_9PAST|nr:hypothetical protein [Gallibacterium anatis]ERF77265.1 hypothetical protein N561_12465 [Gallibacterium anatis 12656/12]MBP4133599.1 hypothetical protein [Gallibacterium anatis]WAX71188.1 hypothetical protein CF557_10420 [Gallibacterium anatis]WKS97487.1 hypothetical protein NYR19_01235 [Gallibacterium anatis]